VLSYYDVGYQVFDNYSGIGGQVVKHKPEQVNGDSGKHVSGHDNRC
jgi:hypothetical protein